ncbi:MAG: hypothetical protein ACRC1K_18225 [Planctomycetia bacterium]
MGIKLNLRMTLQHHAAVEAMAWSPDGACAAIAAGDATSIV